MTLNRAVKILYAAASVALAAWHLRRGDALYFGLSAGGLLLFPLARLVRARTRRAPRLRAETLMYLYAFFAYVLGHGAQLYILTPYFDKLMHLLSGPLTVLAAWLAFYMLKRGPAPRREDFPLAAAFSLCAALAVAALWEIAEFGFTFATGMDVQRALDQGVRDTMLDMIACLIGSLLSLPAMVAFYRGRSKGLIAGAFSECIGERNHIQTKG